MIVACVRTGVKYDTDYVYRLRNGVARHLGRDHRFVCITDCPKDLPGVETVKIEGMHGWWGKMKLFDPSWRAGQKVVYLDLDVVPVGKISPLADLEVEFGICANFTVIYQQRTGDATYPCKYNSSCMVLGEHLDAKIWEAYRSDERSLQIRAGAYGDQRAIEWLAPSATLLQSRLPAGFFLGYRDLPATAGRPPTTALVVFAGKNKPHNTTCKWGDYLGARS